MTSELWLDTMPARFGFFGWKSNNARIALASVFVALSLALFSLPSQADVCQRKLLPLEGNWHDYRQGEFIVQYTVAGEHALQAPTDTQTTGVPDVVADATTQLMAMHDMLKHLGFQLPLESQRYHGQGASHILVRFRKMDGLNGRAFDEVRRLPSGECVLIIELTNRYRTGNLTPAHELFHQVQNGYAPFKRPWFYEGTARWAETILGKESVAADPYPMSEADRRSFWAKSYAAVPTWYGLLKQCDRNPTDVAIPDDLRNLRYRDGRPVISDADILGHSFIRQVLEELATLGDRISNKEGINPHRWPEKTQRDSRFDSEMWHVVLQVGNSCLPRTPND
ncbi:MAG: hypothetical protein GX049_14275 [Alcaligenaceae bacterium]|nr:hypothetical protein [Alcaligenaceae bacterium]